ncbi:MAG: pilus assembly protein [Burkholderiales bacterium RIFCSPHIGHO2_12_FULL_61_11]|nr:MAG: pilus assembly protein [Burkholderiales bacterium RIFCSPHIGHO2_12_FULL_61_11]
MVKEHRIEPRERIALPLNLGNGGQGMTRDISASGLFFETDREQRLGGLIDFEIEFDRIGGLMKFKAQGEIVRIEERADKSGAALKFLVTRLEPVE